MATNIELADAIRNDPSLLGIPHSTVDCQAAVERALKLVGVNVNYKGSNDMWRNMVTERNSIDWYRNTFGELIPGLICFTLRHDGSEVRRGYHDDMGASTHVGIILDDKMCFQSGARGTEIIEISRTSFNQVARCKHIVYEGMDTSPTLTKKLDDLYNLIHEALVRLEEIRDDA